MSSQTQDIQAQLDAGMCPEFSSNGTYLDYPLFVNNSGIRFKGTGHKLRSPIDAKKSGNAVVLGFPRKGLVNYGHMPPSGTFRTWNDTHLMGKEGDFDLGPGIKGWPSVTRFQVELVTQLHSPTTWDNLPLMGITGDLWWMGGPSKPCPWNIYFGAGRIYVAIQTINPTQPDVQGVKRVFSSSFPTNRPAIDKITIVVDFNAGLVRILDLGIDLVVDTSQAGPGWGTGLRFAPNNEWPFCIGRLDSYMLSDRGLTTRYDATFKFINFSCGLDDGTLWSAADNFKCVLHGANHVPEYPLARCNSRNGLGTKYLYVIHESQSGVGSDTANVNDIYMEDVEFHGSAGHSVAMLGRIQGGLGLHINRVKFVEGSSALGCFMMNTMYPIKMENTNFHNQTVRNICLLWGSRVSITDSPMEHNGREFIRMMGGSGEVSGMIMTPPTVGSQSSIYQAGGNWRWKDLNINYEGQAYIPPVVQFRSASFLMAQWHDMACEVTNCQPGGQPGHNAGPQVLVESLETADASLPNPPKVTVWVANQDYRARDVQFLPGVDQTKVDLLTIGELVVPEPVGT